MIEINRIWGLNDITDVLKRPRVSIKVDQYVWDFVYENLVSPKKLMQSEKWIYRLVIDMHNKNSNERSFLRNNVYNPNYISNKDNRYDDIPQQMGDLDRLFNPMEFQTRGKTVKSSHVSIYSPLIDNQINPEQYADLLFDGFGSFLTYNFSKVKKSEMDGIKSGLFKDVINSYTFPAPFEEHQYIGDGSTISFGPRGSKEYVIKDYYKSHFGI